MRLRNEKQYNTRKTQIMEACFDCYAEHGLHGTGISALSVACNMSRATLYTYFEDLDALIIESTEHCMSKVEDDFMKKAPRNPSEIMSFIDEIPYWTAREHGKKYRLMYQIYTHPKYIEYGKKFFEGVNQRYQEYAKQLEPATGIPSDIMTSLIFTLVRASVHYAMFEDEYYLQAQLKLIKAEVKNLLEQREMI